jgi:hypothetical protein
MSTHADADLPEIIGSDGRLHEDEKCVLFPGIWGVFLQIVLGICSLSILFVKHKCERSQRTFDVFLQDTSKQVFGQLFIHFLNLVFAVILAMGYQHSNACHWYFIEIVTDCTFGCLIIWGLLKWSQYTFEYQSGNYQGSRDEYIRQLYHYLFIVALMKILMGMLQMAFERPLLAASGYILAPFEVCYIELSQVIRYFDFKHALINIIYFNLALFVNRDRQSKCCLW